PSKVFCFFCSHLTILLAINPFLLSKVSCLIAFPITSLRTPSKNLICPLKPNREFPSFRIFEESLRKLALTKSRTKPSRKDFLISVAIALLIGELSALILLLLNIPGGELSVTTFLTLLTFFITRLNRNFFRPSSKNLNFEVSTSLDKFVIKFLYFLDNGKSPNCFNTFNLFNIKALSAN